MGRERVTGSFDATVSRHNSPEDDDHNELWNEMADKITAILEDPKFEPISPGAMISEVPRERQWTEDYDG